jgi:hypothetical protein
MRAGSGKGEGSSIISVAVQRPAPGSQREYSAACSARSDPLRIRSACSTSWIW